MMNNLIGVSGKKKSGKSTIAELVRLYHPHVTVFNFADNVKQQVSHATGHSLQYINEHKDNFRLILQGWGTDYRRKLCGDDYWIKIWLQGVAYIRSTNPSTTIIAADVRFLNEVEAIKSLNGEVWRVDRVQLETDTHASECELDNYNKFDRTINNDFGIEELASIVRGLVKQ